MSADLDRELEHYGRWLQERQSAITGPEVRSGTDDRYPVVARLEVDVDQADRSQRRSPSILAVAAAAVLVAGVAGGAWLGLSRSTTRSNDEPQLPSAPAVSTPPAESVARWCDQLLADATAFAPDEGVFAAWHEGTSFPPPVWTESEQIVIRDDDWVLSCVPDSSTPPNRIGLSQLGPRTNPAPPADDRVVVEMQYYYESDQAAASGPAGISVVGRVGSEVAAVELEFDDGSILRGVIVDGWFRILGDLPAVSRPSSEHLTWTLHDGSERSAS